jgi:hypothetical protein
MITVYRNLLRLYPAEYRELFGEEMIAVLLDVRAENASRGFITRVRFYVREIAGLIGGALREHLLVGTDAHVGLSLSTRRFAMRNGFRFPKSTAALMTVILLGAILAIRKGEAIAYSPPHVDPQLPPIHPMPSDLLSGIPFFFLFFYAAGLIGWAILFALRRSGVHRLAEMSGERK